MIERSLAWSGDLSTFAVVIAAILAAAGLALIAWELLRSPSKRWIVAISGAIATILLLLAILRPARVRALVTHIGPRVLLLTDRSASMALPGDDVSRLQAARFAVEALRISAPDARFTLRGFGEGVASDFDPSRQDAAAIQQRSDLTAALESVGSDADEAPSAIVVLSDGRLDRPTAEAVGDTRTGHLELARTPIHTVSVASQDPSDASIRSVGTAGAAVAHQSFVLRVAVGCSGSMRCEAIPVSVAELAESGPPVLLASGVATMLDNAGVVELPLTLDRAGRRVVSVSIASPAGDEIPDNDTRRITFDVTRDRVRVLHVAGRPTYDVRALRMWLKADASLDVVAFFILRSLTDNVNASMDELALIRFPVEELFSEHLPSFDAVVLQDFNADPYGLRPYLDNLARYVEHGGGLIMVGGHDAFSSGGYAGSPLEKVLPVALVPPGAAELVDLKPFVPSWSAAGRDAPVLAGLRDLLGDDLPMVSGSNVIGDAHAGTVVLWEHPTRKTPSGRPMPILALGEQGNGRSVAMTIDDAHKLAFSETAVRTSGRAFGSLWDGLLGWLMREPRYEAARVEVVGGCVADVPVRLQVRSTLGVAGEVELKLTTLGSGEPARIFPAPPVKDAHGFELTLPALPPGGYSASVRVGGGPATRQDFACERGGDEWADPRPDPKRLDRLAEASGGTAVSWRNATELKFPKTTAVSSEREVTPVLPPWGWTLAASMALGLHWIARRKFGLH